MHPESELSLSARDVKSVALFLHFVQNRDDLDRRMRNRETPLDTAADIGVARQDSHGPDYTRIEQCLDSWPPEKNRADPSTKVGTDFYSNVIVTDGHHPEFFQYWSPAGLCETLVGIHALRVAGRRNRTGRHERVA